MISRAFLVDIFLDKWKTHYTIILSCTNDDDRTDTSIHSIHAAGFSRESLEILKDSIYFISPSIELFVNQRRSEV